MKNNGIKVGVTYHNSGKGKTLRKVLAIGDGERPSCYYSMADAPDEPGVLYECPNGITGQLYLSSFASWAGGVVPL